MKELCHFQQLVDKNEVLQPQCVTFYQQIFVTPTVGPTQVMFDDNGTHNYWDYQLEGYHVHINFQVYRTLATTNIVKHLYRVVCWINI